MSDSKTEVVSLNLLEADWILPTPRVNAYSNVQAIRGTSWDVTIRFGEIVIGPRMDQVGVSEVASVTLSKDQFLEFARIIKEHSDKVLSGTVFKTEMPK